MNKEFEKVKDTFRKIKIMLSNEQKKYGILILILALIAAVLETIGVSVILPVLQIMVNAEDLWNKWYVSILRKFMNIESTLQIVSLVCVGVILIYIIKNIYFIFYNWASKKYANKIKRELSIRILRAYMSQGYIFFVNNNSSRLLQGINGDTSGVYSIINQLFTLAVKSFTILAIGIFIFIKSPAIALYLLGLAIACIIIIQLIYRRSMQKNGKKQRIYAWECTQASMEAIQGNKEVLVMNRQDYFVNRFEKYMVLGNKASIKVEMGAAVPAYLIETICVTGLLLAVAAQSGKMDNAAMLEQLVAVAVAAFRILPAVGSIIASINTITFSMPSFNAAYDTLSKVEEIEKDSKDILEDFADNQEKTGIIEIKNNITLENISYAYPNTDKNVIENLSLEIRVKSSIAFIGSSGTGKTTLADIILGLLIPDSGEIYLDEVNIKSLRGSWNKLIGYVPQNVYLIDDSVRNNIAFGIPKEEIDDEMIWAALEMAQLKDFVIELPDQLESKVGEWGVRFSGGQRQRIAIARALYHNPEILVLDEATAALDNETEKAVMDAINALQGKKTLIIVAHRLTTIRNCDYIYEIIDGKAKEKSKQDILK